MIDYGNIIKELGAWRGGENTDAYREKGGAGITNSEMRHAIRMGDNTTVIRV